MSIKKQTIFVLLIFTSLQSKSQCNLLCNMDFENLQVTSPASFTLVNSSQVPCWKTTASDGIIEIWSSGYMGFMSPTPVPSYSGNQFIELNANFVSTLYQDFIATPSTTVIVSFAHRGRAGVDDMSCSIGPVGGPYTNLGTFSDGNTAWGYHTVSYAVPSGTNTNYSLRFNSVSATGGNQALGNFLDAISVNYIEPSISLTAISNTNICAGQSVTITPSGANTYTLLPGNITGNSFIITTPSTSITYTINGTTVGGCINSPSLQLTTSINVTPNPTLSITSVSNNSICVGFTSTISVNGAATYTLTSGTTTLINLPFIVSPLTSTNYTLSGTNSFGCIGANSPIVNITVLSTPTISTLGSNSTSVCIGNSATITPIGAGNYTFSTNTSTLIQNGVVATHSISTTYTISGTSAQGCSSNSLSIAIFSVIVSPLPSIIINSQQNVLCFGEATGSVSLTGMGGTGTTTITPTSINSLVAGNYIYTIVDALGCINNNTLIITQPATALASTSSTISSNTNCNTYNGSASANITGGTPTYSIVWSNGETTTTAVNLGTGISTYTIIDVNECLAPIGMVDLSGVTSITTSVVNQASINCVGFNTGGVTFTTSGTGPFSYSLTNNTNTLINTSGNFNALLANHYTLYVTGLGGCIDTETITITQPTSSLSINAIILNSVACYGDTAKVYINVTGGTFPYTYEWQANSSIIDTAYYISGTYTMLVSDANGCSATLQNIAITQPTAALSINVISQQASCYMQNTGNITIEAVGGTPLYNVLWNNGETGYSLTNIGTGIVTVTVSDANNCLGVYTITINEEKCFEFNIPNMFTPNADSKNEFFVITGVEQYPNNALYIYNRWGNLVYSKKKYDNTFDGKANVNNVIGNEKLPAATYFVIFEFDTDETKPYRGYLELKY